MEQKVLNAWASLRLLFVPKLKVLEFRTVYTFGYEAYLTDRSDLSELLFPLKATVESSTAAVVMTMHSLRSLEELRLTDIPFDSLSCLLSNFQTLDIDAMAKLPRVPAEPATLR